MGVENVNCGRCSFVHRAGAGCPACETELVSEAAADRNRRRAADRDRPLIDAEAIRGLEVGVRSFRGLEVCGRVWSVTTNRDSAAWNSFVYKRNGDDVDEFVCAASSRTAEGLINGLRALLLSDKNVPYLVTVALVGERNPIHGGK